MSIIAVSGTHGTGKTTKIYELASAYKKAHKNKEISILNEQIRMCPFSINRTGNMETQL